MSRTVSRLTPPDASVTARPATLATAGSEHVERHVVEQHGIGAVRERLIELGERRDLDLDLDHVAGLRACALQSRPDAARRDDVIVLDEDGVVEPEAVVGPPPARTASFSNARSPGVVLRVSMMRARVPATFST